MTIIRNINGIDIEITLTTAELMEAAQEYSDEKLCEKLEDKLYQTMLTIAEEKSIYVNTDAFPDIKQHFLNFLYLDTVAKQITDFLTSYKKLLLKYDEEKAFDELCYEFDINSEVSTFFDGYIPMFEYLRRKAIPLMKKRRIDMSHKDELISSYMKEQLMSQKIFPFNDYADDPKTMMRFVREDMAEWFSSIMYPGEEL